MLYNCFFGVSYFLAALVEEQSIQPENAGKDAPGVPLGTSHSSQKYQF